MADPTDIRIPTDALSPESGLGACPVHPWACCTCCPEPDTREKLPPTHRPFGRPDQMTPAELERRSDILARRLDELDII